MRTKLLPQQVSGGYSRFKVTWMFEWEQKSKAQKIPGPKITPPTPPPKKNSIHNYAAGISRQTTNNNFQLNQAILSYPKKNPEIENFKPKKSFDQTRHLKSRVLLGFRSIPISKIESFAYDVLHNSKTDCRIRSLIGETYK